ncbi:MAG: hypothetical protein EAZ87_12785 [Nostocales cyanobacterium]|nr:MAG: hypothetical protein EAZ87_12785 [Nostocales cyanobacterium]
MIKSPLLMVISDHDQELIIGGNQPQVNNNNYTQKNSHTSQNNQTDRLGNIIQNTTNFTDVKSGSQSILSSDLIDNTQPHGINNLTVIPE